MMWVSIRQDISRGSISRKSLARI